MADNKLLLKRGPEEEFLAEDDPLAELARIVGFDSASVAKAATPAQRREPAFDLEDELLKELEIYAQPAAPEAAPVVSAFSPVAQPELEAAPAIEIDSAAPSVDAAPAREPVTLEAVETFSEAAEGLVYERPASHPVFDLEDEILREFAAFDARHVRGSEEHPVAAEVVRHGLPDAVAAPVELHDAPDVRSMTAAPISRERGRDIYESFRDDDLDDAISGVVSTPQEAAPVPPTANALTDTADERPTLRTVEHGPTDLVADVGGSAGSETAAAQHELPEDASADTGPVADGFVEPSIEEFVELSPDEGRSQDFADEAPAAQALPAQPVPEPVVASVGASARQTPANDYGLDALLAEVESYSVGDAPGRWGVHSKTVAAEEVAKAAPPVVQDFMPHIAATASAPAFHAPADAAPAADETDTAWEDSSFEIDLGDIEIDLSDLEEGDIAASPELLAELADTPVTQVEPAARPAAHRAADTDYSSLPFDPSQIVQEDETFEAIAELDVPDVPVVHEEEKPAPHPEYDIDLDAEMAQLFATATAQPATASRPAQALDGEASLTGALTRGQHTSLDLDEFERALEEDFRRSFAENRSGSNPDRVALAPVYAEPVQSRSRRSLLLLASAAVAVVLFGGAGVYAYLSGDTKILASSEPKVILADTDPVKVVPDDPGGKQVPNQNKAVYDRVSGAMPDETKQESLVTSNEEPVDVVQRTLMPENLPMDDDSMAAATPTGDTVDPRLLPDEEEKDRVTTTSKVVSGVSPRKVKTMVVRPDGTLVEREVTEDDLKQQAANDAELMKIAQKAAQDAATASDSQGDDIAKTIESVPERLAPSDEAAQTPVETADDKTARVEETKPAAAVEDKVTDVAPVRIEDEQPAVAEKPAEEVAPVAATDLKPASDAAEEKSANAAAETKPVEATVAEQPVERSIAADGAQTAVDVEAAAKVAEAEVEDAPVRKVKTTTITPVPEVRPVDQPVTVVGTVTDQGTVRSDAEAKPQEVALADPATRTPAGTTTLPAGSYVIQIASLPSEAEAQTSYSRLSAKFAGIIGGRGVDIRKAEIKNKGTYYRVRIPAGSKQEAQALCTQYKKAGGSCLVSK